MDVDGQSEAAASPSSSSKHQHAVEESQSMAKRGSSVSLPSLGFEQHSPMSSSSASSTAAASPSEKQAATVVLSSSSVVVMEIDSDSDSSLSSASRHDASRPKPVSINNVPTKPSVARTASNKKRKQQQQETATTTGGIASTSATAQPDKAAKKAKKKELTEEEKAEKERLEAEKAAKKAAAEEKKRIKEIEKAKKDAERAKKEAEKAKKEAELAKKEEIEKKRRNAFHGFFAKAGTSPVESLNGRSSSAGPSNAVMQIEDGQSSVASTSAALGSAEVASNTLSAKKNRATSSSSDYAAAFKPFYLRQGVTLAPINAFIAQRKNKNAQSSPESSDIVSKIDTQPNLTPQESLQEFLALASPSRLPSKKRERENNSVNQLMQAILEAEVASNEHEALRLHGILRDTSRVPMKLLRFAADVRPGYFGTWTKQSSVIRDGRNCFKTDKSLLDYEYDSEAEWEEDDPEAEAPGEDIAGEDSAEAESDDEDDLDGWLAGDDEQIEMEEGWDPEDVDGGHPGMNDDDDPFLAAKMLDRKVKTMAVKKKKKKPTANVQPIIKGPYFAAECREDPETRRLRKYLGGFSIDFLNGNSAGSLDPFVFVEKTVRGGPGSKAGPGPSASSGSLITVASGANGLAVKKTLLAAEDLPMFDAAVLSSSATTKPKLIDDLVVAFEGKKVPKARLTRQVDERVRKLTKKEGAEKPGESVWEIVLTPPPSASPANASADITLNAVKSESVALALSN